jgi:HD superfamily phosphodiesterase
MNDIINKVRKEVCDLFLEESEDIHATYRTGSWIFPNHFDPMIKISKDLCLEYGGDVEICELACLLHDAGLVYKREGKSSRGHEKNSLEFARKVLSKHGFEESKICMVLKCIEATEIKCNPNDVNEKIVRTADILSQYYSIHFFAKARFYSEWENYVKFLEKKVEKGFEKICFEKEREEARPIRDYLRMVLSEYKKYNSN